LIYYVAYPCIACNESRNRRRQSAQRGSGGAAAAKYRAKREFLSGGQRNSAFPEQDVSSSGLPGASWAVEQEKPFEPFAGDIQIHSSLQDSNDAIGAAAAAVKLNVIAPKRRVAGAVATSTSTAIGKKAGATAVVAGDAKMMQHAGDIARSNNTSADNNDKQDRAAQSSALILQSITRELKAHADNPTLSPPVLLYRAGSGLCVVDDDDEDGDDDNTDKYKLAIIKEQQQHDNSSSSDDEE
jgi:hypothetical protein